MRPLVTPEQLKEFVGLTTVDIPELQGVCDAVIGLIQGYHGVREEYPEQYYFGALLLASRLWRRRNSPAGVEAMGDTNPVYVQRNDPDIAQLLEIGRYRKPKVG